MQIVFATNNPHKLEEVNAIAGTCGFEFLLPPIGFNPIEDGASFYENALIKSKSASKLSGKISLADDSGLCVEALDGAPGLYSARYAGSQAEKIEKLLEELKSHENRRAKFVCAMVLTDKNGEELIAVQGECHGSITFESKGENGFGYDPIFEVDGTGLTMAEMPEAVKNEISHRANALCLMIERAQNLKDFAL